MPRMPAHLFVEDVGGDGMTRQVCKVSGVTNWVAPAVITTCTERSCFVNFAGYISSFVLIWVVRVGSAWGNFSKVKRGILEGV